VVFDSQKSRVGAMSALDLTLRGPVIRVHGTLGLRADNILTTPTIPVRKRPRGEGTGPCMTQSGECGRHSSRAKTWRASAAGRHHRAITGQTTKH
jgi:hypothetical protein